MSNYNNYDLIVESRDINDVIDSIETEDLGDHIYFGPQADIMERLNRFNTRHHADLEITKTFKWKRGTYEKVSNLMMKGLGFQRKPSGMYNFLSREDYFRLNRWDWIKTELREMDNMICNLRYYNEEWLDDPSVLVEYKDTFKNYLSEQAEKAAPVADGIDMYDSMWYRLYSHPSSRSNQRYILNTSITFSPPAIRVYSSASVRAETEATHIADIPCDMQIELNIINYPIKDMITNKLSYNRPKFNTYNYGTVYTFDNRGRLKFPYISGNHYRDSGNIFGNSVCWGDDATNVSNAMGRYDLTSLLIQIPNWATRYTTNTNPYHNIKAAYHGEPKLINDEFRAIFGTSSPDDCYYSPSGENDYCDTAECALRSRCSLYKDAYPEPVSPEQAEQLTLQWATRMGGINHAAPTVIHTTDSAGNPISVTRDNTSTGNIHGGEMPNPENREFTLQEIELDEPWPDESPQGDEM